MNNSKRFVFLFLFLVYHTIPIFAGENYSIVLGNNIKLKFFMSSFDKSKHNIKKCIVNDDWEGVCLIDNRPFFGTDWELPTTQLDSAYVLINNQKVYLDVFSMYNPKINDSIENRYKIQSIEGGLLLEGNFSDGAGSYKSQWIIISESSLRTYIYHSGY